jgi:uncharacterized protein
MTSKTILIAGGSGLIGSRLTNHLLKQGHQVAWLSRNPKEKIKDVNIFFWNPEKKELDQNAFSNVDVFINLSGAGIADSKWTAERKKQIIDSRTHPQNFLAEQLAGMNFRGALHIAASAIGFYGAQTSPEIFEESSKPSNDFMGTTCEVWEEASQQLNPFFDRNVVLRIGVVLSKGGGALNKMDLQFKLGLGAALGSGKQFMPWIHEEDLISIFATAIDSGRLTGVYNAVAPSHVTNLEFSAILAKSLSRPFFLPPIPAFVLRIILGEMAVMVLEGSRVSSAKLQQAGFKFKFPALTNALNNIYA